MTLMIAHSASTFVTSTVVCTIGIFKIKIPVINAEFDVHKILQLPIIGLERIHVYTVSVHGFLCYEFMNLNMNRTNIVWLCLEPMTLLILIIVLCLNLSYITKYYMSKASTHSTCISDDILSKAHGHGPSVCDDIMSKFLDMKIKFN